MTGQILLALVGLFSGAVIASGVVAFMISLRIVPRYAGITRTAERVKLYEDCAVAGAFLEICSGSTGSLYRWAKRDLFSAVCFSASFWEAGSWRWEKS